MEWRRAGADAKERAPFASAFLNILSILPERFYSCDEHQHCFSYQDWDAGDCTDRLVWEFIHKSVNIKVFGGYCAV